MIKIALIAICTALATSLFAADIYVARNGNDRNAGSLEKPLATIEAARNKVRATRGAVTVFLRDGTYYLSKPVVFGAED